MAGYAPFSFHRAAPSAPLGFSRSLAALRAVGLLRILRHGPALAFAPLALDMLGPCRGSRLDIVADFRAGRKIGRGVTVIAALVVAQRKQRHLVGVNALD